MNIGEAARASGVSAKMIRYYESVALLTEPERSNTGYRKYSDADIETLRFLCRARNLGFSVRQMRDLLALWRDGGRTSANVKQLALEHIAALHAKAREIAEITGALQRLVDACSGDRRPDCPIIDELAAAIIAPRPPPSKSRVKAATQSKRINSLTRPR